MKRISGFVGGVITTAAIGALSISTLAATGAIQITVSPINVEVNGATFQPKDVDGNDVMVFSYNGTTYAPLRALAEAYGLTVGYDAEKNLATVTEAGTQEVVSGSATQDSVVSVLTSEITQKTVTYNGVDVNEITYNGKNYCNMGDLYKAYKSSMVENITVAYDAETNTITYGITDYSGESPYTMKTILYTLNAYNDNIILYNGTNYLEYDFFIATILPACS